MTSMPAEAAEWASRYGASTPVQELPTCSLAKTWSLSSPTGPAHLRILPHHADLQREVHALKHARARLGAVHAPVLLACNTELRAHLTVQPRGERMDDPIRIDLNAPDVQCQAGQMLRRLHESLGPDEHARAVDNTKRYIAHTAWLLRQGNRALRAHEATIRHRLDLLVEHVPHLPHAFCHGAFGPTSWRWHHDLGLLAVTGFTGAQTMATAIDTARPLLWAKSPAAQEAFAEGYGRPLTDLEQHLLPDFALLAAVRDICRATRLRDGKAFVHAGTALHRALGQLETT